jgi:hypothetical protein
MATRLALAALLSMSVASGSGANGGGAKGGAPDGGADGQPREEAQTGPEVGGSRSDVSPPLRDLKVPPDPPGHRVHPWRRIPRPQHTPAEEAPGTTPPAATQSTNGAPVDPQEPVRATQPDPRQRTRKKPSRPPRSPRKDQDSAPGSKGGRRSAAKPGAGTSTDTKTNTKTKKSPKPGAGTTDQER